MNKARKTTHVIEDPSQNRYDSEARTLFLERYRSKDLSGIVLCGVKSLQKTERGGTRDVITYHVRVRPGMTLCCQTAPFSAGGKHMLTIAADCVITDQIRPPDELCGKCAAHMAAGRA